MRSGKTSAVCLWSPRSSRRMRINYALMTPTPPNRCPPAGLPHVSQPLKPGEISLSQLLQRLLPNWNVSCCYKKPSIKQHCCTLFSLTGRVQCSIPRAEPRVPLLSSTALEAERPPWAARAINHCHVPAIKTHRRQLCKHLCVSQGNLTNTKSCRKAPSSNNYFVHKESKWFKSSTLTLKSNISTYGV